VGRSSSLTGTFKDKSGNNMTAGNATTLMSSGSSDSLYGPGHNAEIFTDSKGQDYIFYHCHSKAVGAGADLRYGCLQRLYWGSDGWPYVTNGKPASSDVAPQF
jgi:arabinan endo-1,5-alpha-L-arabinosidase